MPESVNGQELPEGWFDLSTEDMMALAERVGVDVAAVSEPLTARQIRTIILAEMTAEPAAADARTLARAVSNRWSAFSDAELEDLEQAFGSYDPTDPLYTELLAETEQRSDASPHPTNSRPSCPGAYS